MMRLHLCRCSMPINMMKAFWSQGSQARSHNLVVEASAAMSRSGWWGNWGWGDGWSSNSGGNQWQGGSDQEQQGWSAGEPEPQGNNQNKNKMGEPKEEPQQPKEEPKEENPKEEEPKEEEPKEEERKEEQLAEIEEPATKEARTDTPRSSTSWMEKRQARMFDVPFAGGKGSTSVRSAQGGTTAHL